MHRAMIVTVGLLSSLNGLCACSSSRADTGANGGAAGVGVGVGGNSAGAAGTGTAGAAPLGGRSGVSSGGVSSGGASSGGASSGGASSGGGGASGGSTFTPGATAMMTKGWLYTMGNQILVSNGGSSAGTRWVGRGVNMDDLFFCGYNNTLMTQGAEALLKSEIDGLFSAWKPNFVRISLAMNSFPVKASWLSDNASYKTPMTHLINAIGAHPDTYVLVSVRSDVTMVGYDPDNMEATGVPSDSTNTPDKAKYPTGTDAVYVALVDSFAQDPYVLFGLTNEAGGNTGTENKIRAAMSHAVTTIRTEEDKLGVPHHLVSVQGLGYTSDISIYGKQPLTQDNVVYEQHGYPPSPKSYTFDNIPVVIGEYGTLDGSNAPAFFQDIDTKQISSLAWDFDPYSDCAPDLLDITTDASKLTPNDWGKLVQAYLIKHAAP
ncbi:MAG: cellulase family glycosylhydrolase [Polyangiaceae bacterium]